MELRELLYHYVNWADRYIPPRPRRVVTWDGFLRHGSAKQHWDTVLALVRKVEAGDDLKPFLSDRVDRFGYAGQHRNKWHDKDYALNAYDTHHLHLEPSGTTELLYVSFSRDEVFLVMVGDHRSFDDGTLGQAIAEARVGTSHEFKGILGLKHQRTMIEQNQIQRRGFTTCSEINGRFVVGAMLTATGASYVHSRHADRMILRIEQLDPQLDQPGFGREWFERNATTYPATPAFEWVVHYCDLYLVETTTSIGFPMVKSRR